MFFFGRITVVNVESRKKIVLPSTSSPNGKAACQMDESTLNLTYTLAEEIQNLDLRFVFNKDLRTWQSSNTHISVKCTGSGKTCVNVPDGQLQLDWLTAPSNMSYKCTNPPVSRIISNAKSTPLGIQFYWLQLQPFDVSGGRFNAAVDCTGLFSIPIWSVLLVSFLLIGILSYGLVMLSAVQPNALYDDPKSKMVQLGGNN
ncbi:hypothetical protein FBUS_07101 [Fasciolopsis buskii]|uniref:V-type proton ATPase subunit S1/VOA1 transmembrane domain-containing protein n=1 Tax=Fasciolopsis buskii TaxID=27845 RepID=A0A8E0S0Q9_9TREM|nr:hypothetical protein FBUS_07101 [Fasciolopsis buski]